MIRFNLIEEIERSDFYWEKKVKRFFSFFWSKKKNWKFDEIHFIQKHVIVCVSKWFANLKKKMILKKKKMKVKLTKKRKVWKENINKYMKIAYIEYLFAVKLENFIWTRFWTQNNRKDSFAYSTLTRIQISASVVELNDWLCSVTNNLNHVQIEPGNALHSSVGKLTYRWSICQTLNKKTMTCLPSGHVTQSKWIFLQW